MVRYIVDYLIVFMFMLKDGLKLSHNLVKNDSCTDVVQTSS